MKKIAGKKEFETQIGNPQLTFDLINTGDFLINTWTPISLKTENKGDGTARDISFRFSGPFQYEKENIEFLNPGENFNLELTIKPTDVGKVPMNVELCYNRMDNKTFKFKKKTYIQVNRIEEGRKNITKQTFIVKEFVAGDKYSTSYKTDDKDAAIQFAQAEMEKEHSRMDAKVMTGGGGVGSDMAMMKQEFDKLKQIREMGVITEEEFEVRRKGLLEKWGV